MMMRRRGGRGGCKENYGEEKEGRKRVGGGRVGE